MADIRDAENAERSMKTGGPGSMINLFADQLFNGMGQNEG
jgi:hypothetical protein